MGAASRAMSAGRKPPRHAPKGTIEGGQFIGRSSITHALIRQLLGIGERGQGPDARRGTGRFTTRGGSVASLALPSRAPRVDDRVRDPHTGRLGRVQTMHPDGTGRVAWDDGRVETRPLSELHDPFAEQPLRDPARSFDMARGPEPRRMDTAVVSGTPGRPRGAAERVREAVAGGRVESGVAARLLRGESPASIVDSSTKEGWRDAQRAKLSIAQRDALNGVGADQRELYWLRRAAGQDHGAAMDSVGTPGPVRKAAAARKMATPKAPRTAKKAAPSATRDPRQVRAYLDRSNSREEASSLLQDFTGAELRAVADETGTSLAGASTKDAMRSRIVEHTVGFRLNSQTIRGGSWADTGALRENPVAPAASAEEIAKLRRHAETTRSLGHMRLANNPPGSYHHTRGKQDLADADRMENEADAMERAAATAKKAAAPAKKTTAAQRLSRAAKRPPADIAAALRSATTRDEADTHLQGLTVADLQAVADELGISRSALRANGSRKEDIRSSLVNLEVGGRASFAAMRNLPGSSERFRAPDASPAVAKMARGKAPSGPRSSGLPAKPTLTDFEDLADRISRLRTEEQRLEILQDLNAGELNRLAGRFPGGVGINPSGYMSHRQTALKIPAGLSLEERRRWLARELTPAEQRRRR